MENRNVTIMTNIADPKISIIKLFLLRISSHASISRLNEKSSFGVVYFHINFWKLAKLVLPTPVSPHITKQPLPSA